MDLNTILNNNPVIIDEEYLKKITSKFISMAKQINENSTNENVMNLRNLFKQHLNSDYRSAGTNDDIMALTNYNQELINESIQKGTYMPLNNNMDAIKFNQVGWYTYQSWHLENNKKYNKGEISHRFYINVKASAISDFVKVLISLYKGKNIPFYFKVNANCQLGCKDSIVIYSSTDELENTLTILNIIQNNYPNLINNCNPPHIFTSNINNWVGYASESKTAKDSYTGIITSVFVQSFELVVKEWIKSNPNMYTNYNGTNIPLKDYFNDMLLDKTNKSYSEILRDNAIYVRRLAHLLSAIPRIDKDFYSKIIEQIKTELAKNNIDYKNICFNDDVLQELKNEVMNFNNTSLNKELSQLRKDYFEDQQGTESINNIEKLKQAKEKLIRQYEVGYSNLNNLTNSDGDFSNKMTLPTEKNGIHR